MTSKAVVTFDDLKREFAAIGARWKTLRRKTGQFLNKAKRMSSAGQWNSLQRWIAREYGVSIADQDVCMRIAINEIPESIVGLIAASTLRRIPTQNMPDPNTLYQIYSAEAGGPVKKRFREFSKAEIRDNVNKHGVMDIRDAVKVSENGRTASTAIAEAYRVESGFLVMSVPSLNKEVKLKITSKLVSRLTETEGE